MMNSTRPSNSASGRRNGSSSSSAQQRSHRNFHPRLIATQIVALQCGHYFLRTLLWECQSLFASKSDETMIWWSLDRIFALRITGSHWFMELSNVWLSAAGQAVLLLLLVQKSQQCLDFGVTLHVAHYLLVAFYQHGLPSQLEWYIVQLIALLITVLLGEHLCVQRELDEIPLLTL